MTRNRIRPALLALGTVLATAAAEPEASGQREPVTIQLPAGDPAAGRRAFVTLSCSSCHRVAGDVTLPAPASASPGPPLGPFVATQSASQLATSIVSPAHQITEDLRVNREDGLSPMGDFSDTMTVRQLVDLLAYLRSLGGAD